MPRKNRIVCSDGLYHVINRGNYRALIFETNGAKVAYETCLFEACERFGWQLQAYCIMSNHFHLCLATPMGNLSEGMRWLQATFATRFNRFRDERGHLFQGRFKSLVVEPGRHLLDLVAYIHLNPVRAGLVDFSHLRQYRWTSLSLFPKIRRRPKWLDSSWLAYGESLSDDRSGWNRYCRTLEMKASDDSKAVDEMEQRMNRGWCIGGKNFKKALSMDFFEKEGAVRLEADELKVFNQSQWDALLDSYLERLGKRGKDIACTRKSEPWKVAIAVTMKRETSVTNAWLSEKLSMGAPNAVSDYCGKYVRAIRNFCPYAKKLKTER